MIWSLFRHYLFSRQATALVRTISWVCVGGVGVGVMAMVVVLSVMNGFDGAIRDRLLSVEPHLVVKQEKGGEVEFSKKVNELEQALAGEKGAQMNPYESQDVILKTVDGLYGGAIARGVEPQVLANIINAAQKQEIESAPKGAQKIDPNIISPEEALTSGHVVMGLDLAHSLGVFEGDQVLLVAPESLLLPPGEIPPHQKMTVSRIVRTSVPDIDAQMLFYLRSEGLKALAKYSQVENGVEVRLGDPSKSRSLKASLGPLEKVDASTWEERNSALFYSLMMEKLAMGIFLGLTVLIGSFSILTVLVLLGGQKRQDIGVMMAMGLSPAKTRKLFTGVGLLLSGFGILGGLILGLVICYILDTYPVIRLPEIYYDTRIPVLVDPRVIFGLVVVSAIVAFLSSWLPARHSSRLSPAEAMRPIVSR